MLKNTEAKTSNFKVPKVGIITMVAIPFYTLIIAIKSKP